MRPSIALLPVKPEFCGKSKIMNTEKRKTGLFLLLVGGLAIALYWQSPHHKKGDSNGPSIATGFTVSLPDSEALNHANPDGLFY
jgi:hypothetical protein